MNFNFKNLSENTKRIRIIPKNGTELSANIGVDNPTAMIDEDGVFSVCLSPNETPTISCDGATNYVDFAILVREGVSHDVVSTSLSLIFDGEVLPPMTPPPDWLGESQGDPFPYEIPSGFQIATLTPRFYNLSDVNRKIEIISLSEDMQVFAYNNPTSIQLSDDNSHAGACLSEGCVPSMIHFGNGIYDLDYGTLYGMNMTLQTPKGTVSGDFLVPLPEYSNTLHYLIEQYLYENISLISDGHAEQLVAGGGGGSAFMQVYGGYIQGGDGRQGGSPFNLTLKPLEGAGFDAYGFHFEETETVIHVCGLGEWPGR